MASGQKNPRSSPRTARRPTTRGGGLSPPHRLSTHPRAGEQSLCPGRALRIPPTQGKRRIVELLLMEPVGGGAMAARKEGCEAEKAWADPGLHPVAMLLRGRPEAVRGVVGKRLHVPGYPGVASNGLVACGASA